MPVLEMLNRRAKISPQTYDAEAQTVEAVISTFADVNRRDARGAYIERLDPAGLDTSRLIGAPVLDGHRQGSARDTIGVITAYRFEGAALVATIKISQAADVAPIRDRIREGTLRGVSVGYRVSRWLDTTDPVTKARVRTAAAWVIFEASAVPVPADPGATFRSNTMEDETDVLDPPAAEATVAQTRAAIRQVAQAANMTAEQADDMIDRGLTITEARAEAFEAMQTRSRNTPRIRVVASHDDPAAIRVRREEALYARVSGTVPGGCGTPLHDRLPSRSRPRLP